MKEYYKAYEERYKTIHREEKKAWAGDLPSHILKDVLERYNISKECKILEVGCGEGQNAIYLLQNGYNVHASDVSNEAVKWCKSAAKKAGVSADGFFVLDVLDNDMSEKFDFIYSVSTLHMLVKDEDRKKFLDFVYNHLTPNGVAFITIMGDGKFEKKTDYSKAYDVVDRPFGDRLVKVAETSCRMVSWEHFLKELEDSNLFVLKKYNSTKISGFENSMVVEVKRKIRGKISCMSIVYAKSEEKFMLLNNEGEWVFPKGHLESGETFVETAIREAREESGVKLSAKDCVGQVDEFSFYFDGEDALKVIKVFGFCIEKCQKIKLNSDEGFCDGGWFSAEEILKRLAHQDAKDVFKKFLKKLNKK